MFKKLLILGLLLNLSACLYTDIKLPLDVDTYETHLGDKVGTSSNHSILWLVSWGDAGTKAAAENGKMTQVNHLDQAFESYLFGAYTKSTTIAYGE